MLSLRIAIRYLLSKKSHGAVNVISAISLATVAVAAASMIIVLSVFNGFRSLAEQKLSHLDPDYLLLPAEGKIIAGADLMCDTLRSINGVATAEPEISEQAFATSSGERRMGVNIKGLTETGLAASGLEEVIIDGTGTLATDSAAATPALLSVGVAVDLNLRPTIGLDSLTLYEPRRIGRINPANPMGAFRTAKLQAKGVYQIEQEEYDRSTIVIPFRTAALLLSLAPGEASSIAVQLMTEKAAQAHTHAALAHFADTHHLVLLDRYRQQQAAFRMIAVEKWITFLMLAFILVIASFNIVSTLYMMMLEKRANMHILQAMGATHSLVARIFISQGWLIVIIGGVAGLLLGTLLVLAQQHFGLIGLNAADPALMTVDTYPVRLEATDILTSFAAIVAVAILITPVLMLLRRR